jgi:hypothetical protein
MGIYYFYFEELYEHTREARHLVDVISDWGGLHSILFSIFAIFVASFNEDLKNSKFIRNLFVEHTSTNNKKKIKTKFFDSIKSMDFYRRFRKQNEGEDRSELMEKGKEKLGEIVDVFNIIKQVQKLKALISVMSNILDHEKILRDASELYRHKMTVWKEVDLDFKQDFERKLTID